MQCRTSNNVYSDGSIITSPIVNPIDVGIVNSTCNGAINISDKKDALMIGTSTSTMISKADIPSPSKAKRVKPMTTPVLDEPRDYDAPFVAKMPFTRCFQR